MIMQAAIMVASLNCAMSLEGSPFSFEGHPTAGWATDMPGTDHGWSWAQNGGFGIQGKQRMYLMEDINAPSWWASKYVRFNLLGKTLTFTVDLSGVPCGVVACFYFVALWKPGPGSSYCDIQPNFGGCFEIDVMEANSHAYEASLHTDIGTRNAFDGTCNLNGCYVNVGKLPYTKSGLKTTDLYGPGAKVIDTTRAFQVTASVSEQGYMNVTLSQEGRFLPHFNRTEAANIPGPGKQNHWKLEKYPKPGGISKAEAAKVVAAMKNGVRLVASTWTTADTNWFDGESCNGQPHGDLRGAKISISGLKIEDNPPTAPHNTSQPVNATHEQKYTLGQGAFAVTPNGFTAAVSITLGASAALVGFVMLRTIRGQGFRGNLIQQLSRSWQGMTSASMECAGELLESAPAASNGNVANEQ